MLRAEAMAAYTRSVLEPLVTALERSQSRVSELERENGGLVKENVTLVERLAGLERVRDAAIAHANELEQRLEAATRPPEPAPAPAPCPEPLPPAPNAAGWEDRWQTRLAVATALLLALLAAGLAPAWAR